MTNLITIDCFDKMCDNYLNKNAFSGEILHCPTERIDIFFAQLEQMPDKKFIVVSAGSDYGIHYQQESHPNSDVKKAFYGVDLDGCEKKKGSYAKITLKTANFDSCDPTDKYSIKVDRFTTATFPRIPANVIKWFCANANINEPNVEFLPYGVNSDGHGKDIVESYYKPSLAKHEIPGRIYSNFALNSYNRIFLKNYFKEKWWATHRENANLSIEKFYEELSSHKFAIVPSGNGIDSYRMWECLILGVIPIVEESRWAANCMKAGFNFYMIPSYYGIDDKMIGYLLDNYEKALVWDRKLLTQEYWKQKIENSRQLLKEKV